MRKILFTIASLFIFICSQAQADQVTALKRMIHPRYADTTAANAGGAKKAGNIVYLTISDAIAYRNNANTAWTIGSNGIFNGIITDQTGFGLRYKFPTRTGWTDTTLIDKKYADSIYVKIVKTPVVSSAATLTLAYAGDYVFTGTTTTWTLPAISATLIGRNNAIWIKNRGSGILTLNTAAGSTLYTTAAVATLAIAAGESYLLLPDGNFFNTK